MSEDLVEMKTDIALIKADIKQINKFFNKVEASIDMMAELSKNVAVQDEILKNMNAWVNDIEERVETHRKEDAERQKIIGERLEEYRKSSKEDHQRLADHNAEKRKETNDQILREIREMNAEMLKKINEQNRRINALENWKYYMMGVGAVLIFILAKVGIPGLWG